MNIWDHSSFKNLRKVNCEKSIYSSKSYNIGTLEYWLEGEKHSDGYALIEMKAKEADARRNPINYLEKPTNFVITLLTSNK